MNGKEEVLGYLHRIVSAASLLATPPDVMIDEDTGEDAAIMSDDPSALLDSIVRCIFRASSLELLLQTPANLPDQPILVLDEEDEAFEEPLIQRYELRRVDYLRQLLRAMAPISMDVMARILEINVKKTDTSTCQTLLLLLSVWLPVANHLTPMGTDLLTDKPCPFSSVVDQEVQLLLAEASHNLCKYYCIRREQSTLNKFWDWSLLFQWLSEQMQTEEQDEFTLIPVSMDYIVTWHTARATARVLNFSGGARGEYLQRWGVDEQVLTPWILHPLDAAFEESIYQSLFLEGQTRIWDRENPFSLVSVNLIRPHVPLHRYLVNVGGTGNFVFYKNHAAVLADDKDDNTSTKRRSSFVLTETTSHNLSLLGAAMCIDPNPRPILVCGPQGSGKSSLVRELSDMAAPFADLLLEIHVDEETDTKTLVGSYTTSDIPGQFEWRPGALTQAVRSGQWVLIEDIDRIPVEIQASLVQLFEARLLPLGNGKLEHCHPNFRLFGTMTTSVVDSSPTFSRVSGGMKLLNPELWQNVHIKPMPSVELKDIAIGLHSGLPETVINSALQVFKALDRSGRAHIESEFDNTVLLNGVFWVGRHPSVRDLFKVLARIRNGISFERNAVYTTEGQRTLCMAETVDVFVAASADEAARRDFVRQIAAPVWGITADLAFHYIETRSPLLTVHETCTEIGRVSIPLPLTFHGDRAQSDTFSTTDYTLRLMETIGVCIKQNEPLLLVGETGCGYVSVE
jgi:energy-coupling factor transporter ATP-binding protein EcfA2